MFIVSNAGLRVPKSTSIQPKVDNISVFFLGKITDAAKEQKANQKNKAKATAALEVFRGILETAFLYYQPAVDLKEGVQPLLTFYSNITHSNDIWHRAKNLLKAISAVSLIKKLQCKIRCFL